MKIEDERRWLLPEGIPKEIWSTQAPRSIDRIDTVESITQFYTPTQVGTQRFRHCNGTHGDSYFQTIKGPKQDGAGPEWEVPTEQWVYEMLLQSSIGTVQKTRTTLFIGTECYELDEFTDELAGLVIVELEFHDPGQTPELTEHLHTGFKSLVLPAVFGPSVEITNDSRYSNYQLALHGMPDAHATV